MSNETYVKEGRLPRLVTTPAERVKAEFEGFKPAQSEPDETPVEGNSNAPETNDNGSPLSGSDQDNDPFGA